MSNDTPRYFRVDEIAWPDEQPADTPKELVEESWGTEQRSVSP